MPPPEDLVWESSVPRSVTRTLLGTLAHDVRSPLMALTMNLHGIEELLRSTGVPLEPEMAELLFDARDACTAITGKIDDVRGETTQDEAAEPFRVADVVATALRLFRWHAQQRGVRTSSDVSTALEGFGRASDVAWTLLHALVQASETLAIGATVRVGASEREGIVRVHVEGAKEIDVLVDTRGAVTARLAAPRR